MTIKVTVDAEWRVNRFDFTMIYNNPIVINGYGEVLLAEPKEGIDPKLRGMFKDGFPRAREAGPKTYGTLPSPTIYRLYDNVLGETVEVDGLKISVKNVVDAMTQFLSKWRLEDERKA